MNQKEKLKNTKGPVDVIDLYATVQAERLPYIISLFEGNAGLLQHGYTYEAVSVDTATRTVQVTSAIRSSVSDLISSKNLEGRVFISQSQTRDLIQDISSRMGSSTTATNEKVAALLPDIGEAYASHWS